MEFMNNGDLAGFIKAHEKFNKPVREEEVWNILLQSMNALEYIHSKNIIHRDIKPANLFMTNDKTIKIGDFGVAAKIAGIQTSVRGGGFSGTIVGTPMFMSPEILREEEYDKKTDVYSMGISMYELCFFQSPRKAGISQDGSVVFVNVNLTKNQNLYSSQLLNILQKMIEEDKNKRPTSSDLCKMIRLQYIQTFLKTSSLSAVTRCLYSFSPLIKMLMKVQIDNSRPRPITQGFIQAIQQIQNNIHDKFNQFKETLAIHNPKLNSDNEIDPVFIVAMLLEKMHKELNNVNNTMMRINEPQYLINTTFNGQDEDKSNKNEMLERFFRHFANNFNSAISNLFFGILKEKKICKQCGMFNYNYGCFCILTFDLNELCGFNNNAGVGLINLFQAMHERKKEYNINDKIYCDRCLSYQNHIKNKQLYSMPYNLIISLERGVNCMNKTLVNFSFDLDIANYVEYQSSPKRYQLVGCVNRADINGKEHYVSFTRLHNSDNWIFSDDDKTSPPLLYELLKNITFISNIKIIHPETILDKLTEANLINYNIIIFDLKQCGYENTNTNIKYMRQYIAHGGNILVTHDHWTGLAGPQELFCGYRSFHPQGSIVNTAEIIYKKHRIFNSFYDLSEEKNIVISPSHSSWMKVNETIKKHDTVLMRLKDEINSEYLMQREIGLGKCVFWNVGHNYSLENFEEKLFTNILAWFCE